MGPPISVHVCCIGGVIKEHRAHRFVATQLELLDDVADLFKSMHVVVVTSCGFRDH